MHLKIKNDNKKSCPHQEDVILTIFVICRFQAMKLGT